jgi:hypothetical protein
MGGTALELLITDLKGELLMYKHYIKRRYYNET